jgi:hypothetical protein
VDNSRTRVVGVLGVVRAVESSVQRCDELDENAGALDDNRAGLAEEGKDSTPLLSTFNIQRRWGLAASPGSCRIINGRKPEGTEIGVSKCV